MKIALITYLCAGLVWALSVLINNHVSKTPIVLGLVAELVFLTITVFLWPLWLTSCVLSTIRRAKR